MKYFTIKELTKTNTGIKNIPNQTQTLNLEYLVDNILDPARDDLGFRIYVNSGFRNEAVNKKVGGVKTSQHTKGEAADLSCTDNRKLFDWIRNNVIFDQLIFEFRDENQPQWVHVSLKRNGANRMQVLRAIKEKGKVKYIKF